MLWNGLIGKLMVDFVGKIWYNTRREGRNSFAPFCIFPVKKKSGCELRFFKIFPRRLRLYALADFSKFPHNIVYRLIYVYIYFNVYVYINISAYMYIKNCLKIKSK